MTFSPYLEKSTRRIDLYRAKREEVSLKSEYEVGGNSGKVGTYKLGVIIRVIIRQLLMFP